MTARRAERSFHFIRTAKKTRSVQFARYGGILRHEGRAWPVTSKAVAVRSGRRQVGGHVATARGVHGPTFFSPFSTPANAQ